LDKVEFKQYFEIGYSEIELSANEDETIICIESKYSVPSSMVTSFIINIKGTLFEEKRRGLLCSELIALKSDINVNLFIKLERFEIDPEDFDEDEFIQHLIDEATEKIKETNVSTALKEMEVV
jgi:hypothetical protein